MQGRNAIAKALLPKAPKPDPESNDHVKPAAVSGPEGSVAVAVNVTFSPTRPFGELGVRDVIVGATFRTVTVA